MSSENLRQAAQDILKDLVEVLFKPPYTKRLQLERAGLGSLKTVGNYLKS